MISISIALCTMYYVHVCPYDVLASSIQTLNSLTVRPFDAVAAMQDAPLKAGSCVSVRPSSAVIGKACVPCRPPMHRTGISA